MKTYLSILLLVCLLSVGLSGMATAAPRGWTADYDDALKRATAGNKIMLLNFMGDLKTNKDMDKVHHELLLQESFYQYVEKNGIILVDIVVDADQKNPKVYNFAKTVTAQFSVAGYPVILFATPNGKELGRTGYIEGGPEAFFKLFDDWRAKFKVEGQQQAADDWRAKFKGKGQ